jgi:hypothetical protein
MGRAYQPFYDRRAVDFGVGGGSEVYGLIEYQNVPRPIGTVISKGMATLHELQTVYGSQDLYDLLELIAVDAHNIRILNKAK